MICIGLPAPSCSKRLARRKPLPLLLLLPLLTAASLALTGCAAADGDMAPSAGADADAARSAKDAPYAGQQDRDIKALSADDIAALEAGSGMALGGLAKPAELNSHPGPKHVLDAAEDLELSADQEAEIQALRDAMHGDAVRIGEAYLSAERRIDRAFADGAITEGRLRELLHESADAYADLRLAHLKAHLGTVEVLTPEQVAAYDELRGYADGDPCDSVPEGHDPEMWRQHNDCGDREEG